MFELRKVFTNPLSDPNFGKKFVIGSLIMLFPQTFSLINDILDKEHSKELIFQHLPAFLAASVLVMFLGLTAMGYYFQIINNRIHKSEENLPQWTLGRQFFIGFKAVVGTLIFLIPFWLLGFVSTAVCLILPFLSPFGAACGVIFTISYFVIYLILVLLMNISYAYDFKLVSFFNFIRAKEILSGNIWRFALYMALISAVGIISNIFLFLILLFGGIPALVVIAPLAFYTLLINAEIAGQFVNRAEKKEIIGE